jgi:hypothetical protein
MDIAGRAVYTQDINANGAYRASIDLSHCPRGLYMAVIKTSAGTVVKKMALQ